MYFVFLLNIYLIHHLTPNVERHVCPSKTCLPNNLIWFLFGVYILIWNQIIMRFNEAFCTNWPEVRVRIHIIRILDRTSDGSPDERAMREIDNLLARAWLSWLFSMHQGNFQIYVNIPRISASSVLRQNDPSSPCSLFLVIMTMMVCAGSGENCFWGEIMEKRR